MMRLMRYAGMSRRAPALAAALGLALPLAALPLDAQRARAPRNTCDTCEVEEIARLQRDLARAQRDLNDAAERLAQQREALDASVDTTGERQEAYAKALGDVRRARERYDALMSQMIRRDLERTRMLSERAAARGLARLKAAQSQAPKGWLGVTLSGSSTIEREGGKEIMRFGDYPTVEAVEPDSPAERAGLEAGDRLVALNGRNVLEGMEPFAKLLKPGAHLPIRVKRGRYTKDLMAVVEQRPQNEWPDWSFSFTVPAAPPAPPASAVPAVVPAPFPPPSFPRVSYELQLDSLDGVRIELRSPESATIAGAQVQRAIDDLKEYFAVKDGLVVLRVIPGTPADRAGLRGGDVIVSADGRRITTPMTLSRAMTGSTDRQVKLEIVRKKKKEHVVLKWDR
jgi:C-terminal processing protease CtpA/Prc